MATLSTSVIVRKPTPRLNNSKTNWDIYRQITQDKVNLSLKLKEHEDIELETNKLLSLYGTISQQAVVHPRLTADAHGNKLLSLLQHAAKEATPNSDPQRTTNNIAYEITKLVAANRRARSIWQRTHTPDNRN
jgi:hypothetical protein